MKQSTIITAIAHLIRENNQFGEDNAAFAARVNQADGWTIETSGSMGSVVRHEGIVLNAADLARAVTQSKETA